MTENVHRTEMAEAELRDGVEQLALCGISAAQIAKRTAIRRGVVDAALAVTGNAATRARMDSIGLTLEDAAVFAEFEDDDRDIETLTQALRWNQPLDHVAQRLRDAAAETAVRAAEAERLRAEGLPALDPADTPDNGDPRPGTCTASGSTAWSPPTGNPSPKRTGPACPAQP